MRAGRVAGLLCLVALTSCGGGGGSGGVDASPALDDPPGGPLAVDAAPAPVASPDALPAGAAADPVPAVDAVGEPVDVGALRIVLTWDARPNDLDAHLSGPRPGGRTAFHVFSGDRDAGSVRLIDDATTGSGPEIIEIDRPESGIYRYSVFNFSGDADRPLERSGARVEVFAGDASMAEFGVPAGVGDLWTVFDLDEGRIVEVNAIARLRNVLDYFPPGRDPARVPARTLLQLGPRVSFENRPRAR